MKDDRPYLIHILECTDRIESCTRGGRDAFMTSLWCAVIRNLMVIGEERERSDVDIPVEFPGFLRLERYLSEVPEERRSWPKKSALKPGLRRYAPACDRFIVSALSLRT